MDRNLKEKIVLYEKQLINNRWETVLYPHFYQQLSLLSPAMFIVMLAGKKGGKSSWGAPWILKKFDEHPGEDGMIVAPTYNMLKQIALMKSLFPFIKNTRYEGLGTVNGVKLGYKALDSVYLTPFNIIYLASADKPKHLEGKHVCAIWADELGQFSYDAAKVLTTRIDTAGGQLLGTTTGYDKGWLFLDWHKKYLKGFKNPITGRPVYDFISFPSIANPSFPIELWYQYKEELDPEEFAMDWEGKFGSRAGLVYTKSPVLDPYLSIEPQEFVFAVIDWGWTDKMTFSVMSHNRENDVWKVHKVIAEDKLDLFQFATLTAPEIKRFHIERLYYDWHEKTDPFTLETIYLEKHQIRPLLIPAPVTKIMERVRIIRSYINKDKLILNEDETIDMQDEFAIYKNKSDGNPEEKEHNNTLDPLGYAITAQQEWEKGIPEEVIDISLPKNYLDERIDRLTRIPEDDYYNG
jgi:hypothetical protein